MQAEKLWLTEEEKLGDCNLFCGVEVIIRDVKNPKKQKKDIFLGHKDSSNQCQI